MAARRVLAAVVPMLAAVVAASCCLPLPLGNDSKRNPSGLFVVTVDGRAGYINRKGDVVIPPQFDRAYGFTERLAVVQVGNRLGFIDERGRFVINPQYDDAF